MSERGIVILGAGEAGARAAVAIRERGYDGALTLVGEEPRPTYSRPPLSKAAMVSPTPPALLEVEYARAEFRPPFERILGAAGTRIDRRERVVHLRDGRALPYDKLILATGARPRRLAIPGAELGLTLRTYEDAVALRERLRESARIVIVGAGFIGLELAASAREIGCEVTVVETAPRVLARAAPPELSDIIVERHRREGVEILTGVGVASFSPEAVGLADGRSLSAETIIVGVGAIPETSLAAAAGLEIDNGVAVDGQLRTSDPDIFAIGDCASFPHPLFSGRRMRLEAWRNAVEQGEFVANAVFGNQSEYAAIPWFWSDQYDLCLQIAGVPDAGARVVIRDLGDGARLVFHLTEDGRVVAVGGVGPLGKVGKEVRVGEMLIARRARPDAAALSAPGLRLKSLL